jgi:hypothetical protein
MAVVDIKAKSKCTNAKNSKIRNFANLRQVTSASKASTTGYPGLAEGDASPTSNFSARDCCSYGYSH